MKNRLNYIDIAKGIVIIFVIIGHCFTPKLVNNFIYSFHMPFFFIVAGYFINCNDSFTIFIHKKASRLLFPYIICMLVIALFSILKSIIRSEFILNEVFNWIYRIINANSHSNRNLFNIAGVSVFWFLIALFNASVIFYLIINKTKRPLIYTIIISVFGLLLNKYMSVELPFSLYASLVAVIYLFIGYSARKYYTLISQYKCLLIVISIIVWALDLFYYGENSMIDLAIGRIDNILCFLGSISGTFLIIQFSKLINRMKNIPNILEYFGKNSIIILCVHGFECFFAPISILSNLLYTRGYTISLSNNIIERILITLLGTIFISQFTLLRKVFYIK